MTSVEEAHEPLAARGIAVALVGELLGTFVMVLLGTGAVACAVLTGVLQGLWQVASVWAVGVTVGIYIAAPLSGVKDRPYIDRAEPVDVDQ